ncbi:MAG: 50S ribosomal protein L23 [Acidobacteriota bacterium]
MRVQDVIRQPWITDKVTLAREDTPVYAFVVARDANKVQIRRAVEAQFQVNVAEVRTVNMHGKERRQGRFVGRRPDWKKAYVRLVEGETIELFEG